MQESFTNNDLLTQWIMRETQHIDLVASWEELCQTYRSMEFVDAVNDQTRIEEFKWIVKEVNRFLTNIRKKLLSCQSIDSVKAVLHQNFVPEGKVKLETRRDLVFQKHKQRWIQMMLVQTDEMKMQIAEQEAERKVQQNGWGDQSDDTYADYEW